MDRVTDEAPAADHHDAGSQPLAGDAHLDHRSGRSSDELAEDVPPREASAYDLTGVDAVDAVLSDVAAVVGAPVADHVAVFERAHEQLRRALDATDHPADRDA